MKRLTATILLLHCLAFSSGQNTKIKSMVDDLQYMKADTFNYKADLFWRIVAQKKDAIPFLIEKLTDTTNTNIRYHCKKTRLNVGEVAHFALLEIADFPAFLVTKSQFDFMIIDETGQGCWSFYDFLFINSNKPRYQKNVRDWYAKEKNKYKAEIIPKKKRTYCQRQFGIDTFYRWEE